MPREPPIVLPVTLRLLGHANPWALLLSKEAGYPLATAALLSERYTLKSDEKPFVRELLGRKRNLWVFRCDQRRFAGDFVVYVLATGDQDAMMGFLRARRARQRRMASA
jgi:hypothetical protein